MAFQLRTYTSCSYSSVWIPWRIIGPHDLTMTPIRLPSTTTTSPNWNRGWVITSAPTTAPVLARTFVGSQDVLGLAPQRAALRGHQIALCSRSDKRASRRLHIRGGRSSAHRPASYSSHTDSGR